VRDRFYATQRQNDTNELDPSDRKARMRRFQFGDFQVRSAKYDDQDDNKHSGHRKPDRNATAVSRPEIINDPDNKDQPRGGEPRVIATNTKVTYGNKCQTNNVRLARAPVAIEQRGRAFPIHIARPMYASR